MRTEFSDCKPVEVSVVFPAYNEKDRLEEAVKKTMEALAGFTKSYEIIIAEDGSTDGTDHIAAELSSRHPVVRHSHCDKRLGRGLALKRAFEKSNGQILVYMDVDLATNVKHLASLVESVRTDCDFATGSRMLRESEVTRSLSRHFASKSYNLMVRILLGSKITDHQCGFKSWRRQALLELLDDVKATHWFWDTEMLVRAYRAGYRIREIPITWTDRGGTKVSFIGDSLKMGSQVVKLWFELRK